MSSAMVTMLAQSSSAGSNAAAGAAVAGVLLFMFVIFAVIYVVMALSFSKLLQKAGQPGWPGWVPVYNAWRMFEISGKPGWYGLLFLGGIIPFIGGLIALAGAIMLGLAVGKAFNKSTGFQVGMILLGIVFYPLLAFGDSTYQPQAAQQGFPVGPPQ